ncbi:MAG: protein kinase [Deltaproteobacteria bacterium]|nr:protein kinase [Deltaproteobacteria bacterium]
MEDSTGIVEGQIVASQFKIVKKLGSGGMGAVYLAEQMEMERKVVVKVLHPELTAMNPTAIERFRREARAVAQLNHPNIVQVYVFGQADSGQMYLAMEFIEGRDLSVELARGPMPQPRALRILDQTCAALIEAHGAGIVHRDLKPENIMLADRHGNPDYVKVLDFGIAKLHDTGGQPSLTQAGTVFGTPRYMSPEQVKGEAVDARSDIYALGLIFHEMLTGRHPFTATTTIDYLMKHVHEPVAPPHEAFAELDLQPRVEAVVMRCLEKEPGDRYQSVAEMQRDVRLALRDFSEAARGFPSQPPPAESEAPRTRAKTQPPPKSPTVAPRTQTHQPDEYVPPGSRGGRRRGIHPAVWVVVALALVGGIVGAVVGLRPKGPAGPVALAGDPTAAPPETKATGPSGVGDPDGPDDPDDPDDPAPKDPTRAATTPPETRPPVTMPATSVAEGAPVDGFPLPRDVTHQASVASAEMYQTKLAARDVIGFYKAKLHGRYTVKDIPNGLQIDDQDSPFSYVNLTASGGDLLTLVLTRNTLAPPKPKATTAVEPAFGVEFPSDGAVIVSSAQAVIVRSQKSFAEVCAFYAEDPRFGKAKGILVAKDEKAATPYCSIVNPDTSGANGIAWQAIAIVNDPTVKGAVMVTVAGKTL